MKFLIAISVAAATPAMADIERMEARGSVADATDRLTSAIEEAGATVFATVDHGAGAREVGMDLADARLVIFGNPEIGAPVMQEDIEAGLVLPLRMLVYAEGDQTYVAYEEIGDMVDDFDVDDDLQALEQIESALSGFARSAAGE